MTGKERKDLRKSMNWYLARMNFNKVTSLGAYWAALGFGTVHFVQACQAGDFSWLLYPAAFIVLTGMGTNSARVANFGLKRKYVAARQKIANANTNVIQKTR